LLNIVNIVVYIVNYYSRTNNIVDNIFSKKQYF